MENYRCIGKKCDKKKTCGHYNVKHDSFHKIIKEDLSDICLPNYRLYDCNTDKSFRVYSCKKEYEELFKFYDYECEGENCKYQKPYRGITIEHQSCIECKLGDNITCEDPNHPTNKILKLMFDCIMTEQKAFDDAGITEGTVTYTCPICGGQAVANRYKHGDRYHGLGSGCKTCDRWHS